jgi:SAM-dependent methyltransferase
MEEAEAVPQCCASRLDAVEDPSAVKEREIQARNLRAGEYDDWLYGMRGRYSCEAELRAVTHTLHINRRSRVLDAGCGTGRLTAFLAPRAGQVTAVDFSAASVNVLRQRLADCGLTNVQTMVSDLNRLSVAEGSLDAVASVGVLHHIPTHELRLDALQRLRRALKPGGRLAVVVYRWGGMIGADEPKEGFHSSGIYYHSFERRDLRELVRGAGFRRVRVRGLISWPARLRRHLPPAAALFEPILMAAPWSAYISDFLIASAVR